MASIEKRIRGGQTSWRAHYRTPAGAQRNKTFSRKVDAERFLASVENAKVTAAYVDPALAKARLGNSQDPPGTRGPHPEVPRRRPRASPRRQAAGRPGLRRHPQRPAPASEHLPHRVRCGGQGHRRTRPPPARAPAHRRESGHRERRRRQGRPADAGDTPRRR